MLREWRRHRLEMKVADQRHYLDKWGWHLKPSQSYAQRARLAKLERKLAKLDA